jgi:chromate transporter
MELFAKLIELFLIFAKIGLFTIGGGLAMIPLVRQELLERGYMTVQETLDMVAIAHMTPGPFAVNTATFAGTRMVGLAGGAAATIGVLLPSFVICLLVAKRFFKSLEKLQVRAVLSGIRPVVYALILSGMLSIGGAAVFPNGYLTANGAVAMPDVPVLAIAAVMVVLLMKTKLSPAILVIACGVFGAIFLK